MVEITDWIIDFLRRKFPVVYPARSSLVLPLFFMPKIHIIYLYLLILQIRKVIFMIYRYRFR